MTTGLRDYRLDGIYRQKQEGFFLQRVKLAAGTISSSQARMVAGIAERFGRGGIHLTTRGNMEIHWLHEEELAEVKRLMAAVGLTGRGACGGAVRGVTCANQDVDGFPRVEAMARRIQRHFTGNPRFERLPKKFKIGIEAEGSGRRHLIQDAGLLLVRSQDNRSWYDLWIGGGLGREPQPAFLLEREVAEEHVIPLLEAVLRVYMANAPAGKRVKHLLRQIGVEEFRSRLNADPAAEEQLPPCTGLADTLVPATSTGSQRIRVPLFAGQLTSARLTELADFADTWADGALQVTANQDIAFRLSHSVDPSRAKQALPTGDPASLPAADAVTFRICPGSHECRAGLAATRDISRTILEAMGPTGRGLTWALSGCPNSCTQPQLADGGIVTSGVVAEEGGLRTPRFDLYRPAGEGLNRKAASAVTLEELIATIRNIG
jgi:ferredoxin-nitrite reductase